jgi:hypothetical protein
MYKNVASGVLTLEQVDYLNTCAYYIHVLCEYTIKFKNLSTRENRPHKVKKMMKDIFYNSTRRIYSLYYIVPLFKCSLKEDFNFFFFLSSNFLRPVTFLAAA